MRFHGLLLVCLALTPKMTFAQNEFFEAKVIPTEHGAKFELKNISSIPVIAYAIRFQCSPRHDPTPYRTQDALITYGSKNLSPGEESGFSLADGYPQCPVKVSAIFANARSTGDADDIAFLYDRRKGAYLELVAVKPFVESIANGSAEPAMVADALKRKEQPILSDRTLSAGVAFGEVFVLSAIEGQLRDQMQAYEANASAESLAHRTTIEDVAKARGVSMHQAHAILTGEMIDRWKKALEGHTEMPATDSR